MQMHDVNKPMIKMTRKKIMNLNFFANVYIIPIHSFNAQINECDMIQKSIIFR